MEVDFLAYKAINEISSSDLCTNTPDTMNDPHYTNTNTNTNNPMNEARKLFFKDFLKENSTDQRKLFLATERLLGRENVVEYPQFDDKIA